MSINLCPLASNNIRINIGSIFWGEILAQSTDENRNDEGFFLANGLLDVGVTGLAPAIPRISGAFLLGHMPTESKQDGKKFISQPIFGLSFPFSSERL